MAATPSVLFSSTSQFLPAIRPNALPYTLPPPSPASSASPPFTIPESLYQRLLSANYPITVVLIYATTVTILNRINASRGNKPWAFSKTTAFLWFVILHNVTLAIYSGWTFAGMAKAVHRSVGPALRDRKGAVEIWDSVCKIHGPSGLGNAASYNESVGAWTVSSPTTRLSASGTPSSTDTGRLWNEGLAFYGWIFYLSKFYEVVDTAIVLAKGKRSSTLQTYHHAGAMIGMWAGIRYMAPPIFMFCLFNSCIHTMMITQIVIGSLFAISNVFTSYTIPVEVPYTVLKANNPSRMSSENSVAKSIATTTALASFGNFLKKIALRAAGWPGLAENVTPAAPRQQQKPTGYTAPPSAPEVHETHYRTEHQVVPCLSTSGEAFAIWLNVFYLAPLAWLFVRFFIRSYIRSTSPTAKKVSPHVVGKAKATGDAAKGELNGRPTTHANDGKAETMNGQAQTDGHVETNEEGHANKTAQSGGGML
ncbi:hypothetical protein GP486_008381 [Trichoglossum hirsutum]|uniref:Elongation of fatty acids protein n=1 Tax=Trichoglossum hirsutum TaxID=265104 RepID=A0A9P8L6D3_9PEZI|nr:hypothetical protein GP486_008381 [Trichoglossum hirsutum]